MTDAERTFLQTLRAAASGLDYEIPATVDPVALYRIVRRQHLSAFLWKIGSRLPASRLRDAWERERDSAAMKSLLQSEEKETVDRALSDSGIRFLYLKGAVVKEYWGDPAFRYMGDMDFLYEGDDSALKAALEGVGYAAEIFSSRDYSHHFVFHKDPWFTLEPHFALFDDDDPFRGMLTGLFDRATPDPDLPGRFLISEEDLFLHGLLHARKHIVNGGIGVRSFLDFAFLLRRYPDLPDRERVAEFLERNGLADYASRVLRLARLLTDPAEEPDGEDETELSLLFSSGMFGSLEKGVGNQLDTESHRSRFPRLRYLFKRTFPPLVSMAHKKYRAPLSWLVYPFFWLRRLLRMLFSRKRRKNTGDAIRAVASYKGNEENAGRELRYFGITPAPTERKGEEGRD